MSPRRRVPVGMTLAGILAVALAARMAAYSGQSFSFGSDESRFIAVAQNLSNGYFPNGDTEWFGSRIGLIWPVAAIFQVVPPSDLSTAIWPLIGSLVSVGAAYLCGRELASQRVGLVAAALVAVTPLEALVGSRLRPDALVPGLIALAVWLALRAGRRGGWEAVACGAMLGVAWTVRENAIVLAPILVLAGRPAGRAGLVRGLVGFTLVPAFSAIVFAIGAGNPLPALIGAGTEGQWRNPVARYSWDESYLARLGGATLDAGSPFLLLVPVAICAIVVVLYRQDRRARLPRAWLGWTALYLEFGTLMNLAKPERYLTLCTVPLALLVALALDGRLAWLAPAGLAIVTVIALWSLPARNLRHDDSTLVAQVAARLRGLPPGPVLAESYTWWAKLRTYGARNRLTIPPARDPAFFDADQVAEARRLDPPPDVSAYRGGYVVTGPVHPRPGWPGNWGDVRAAIAQIPPAELRLVTSVGSARIWRWAP